MKKMKRVLSVVLTLMLLTATLTACGQDKKEENNAKPPAETTGNTGNKEEGTKTEGEGDGDAAANPGRPDTPVTLTMYMNGNDITDDTAVLEALNKILDEKLNVTLKPIWGRWDDFNQNVVLSINGGDAVDIYFTCSWTDNEYNKFARMGAYKRLDNPDDNLIEKYAQELWTLLPEVLTNGAKISGLDGVGVYAIPGYKDIATQNCWDVNVDLLKKYGYTLDDIKNTDYYGLGDILKKVKEGEGEQFYPLMAEGAVLERMVNNVAIVTGDTTPNILSYYLNPSDLGTPGAYGNTMVNKFATPEYKKFIEKSREYYLAGYIDPAMAIADQAEAVRTTKQSTGEYLLCTQSYALGYEVQASAERGFEVAMVPVTDAYVDTTSSQGAMMAISSGSKNADRAVMFLNLLNTDPEVMTLLAYGVEGVHYEMVDERVKFLEKRNDYKPWVNGLGNVTQLAPLEGQEKNFQETFKAYYGAAKEIPTLGFCFDFSDYQNEIAALGNVAKEYFLSLNMGSVDPAVKLPELLEKLEANGMSKVVDEANRQLTEYLGSK